MSDFPSTLELLIDALDSADDRLDDEPRPEPPDHEYDPEQPCSECGAYGEDFCAHLSVFAGGIHVS